MNPFSSNNGLFYLADKASKQSKGNEPRIILLSFLAVLLPSAILLTLPVFSVSGLSITDALFTATSAISVTGLGVVDTGQHFTLAGKILLMLLMQIGGLGQMTLSAVLLYMFGVKLSLRQQALAKEALGQDRQVNLRRLVKKIVVFAFVAELIGFVLLAFRWVPEMGWQSGLFYALFHAISAFNNAGFALFSDSMMSFVDDPLVIFTLAGLFIFGGLGFTVVGDVWMNWRRGFHFLHLHTKIMLVATPALLIIGTLLFFVLEQHNASTMGELSTSGQWLAAFFQSASARNCGIQQCRPRPVHATRPTGDDCVDANWCRFNLYRWRDQSLYLRRRVYGDLGIFASKETCGDVSAHRELANCDQISRNHCGQRRNSYHGDVLTHDHRASSV